MGNKNNSSWSLRAWLVLKMGGLQFEEDVVHLGMPETAEEIARRSPTGLVPVLYDGDLRVWDSLAICEYVNERYLGGRFWPEDVQARAVARSCSAEMHSGFASLRHTLPFVCRTVYPPSEHLPEVEADIRRIVEIWTGCRARHGQGGPFLFGRFSIADAMFAPVMFRCRIYSIPLSGEAAAYAGALWELPAIQQWHREALAEQRDF